MTKLTKDEFIELFGESPEDVIGEDWENYIEEFLELMEAENIQIIKNK